MSMRKVRLGHRVDDVPCYPLISDETGKVYSNNGVYALTNLFSVSRDNILFGNIHDASHLLPFGEDGATYICVKQTASEVDLNFVGNAVKLPSNPEWLSVFTCDDGKHNMYHGSLLTFAEDESKLVKTEPEPDADMSQYRRARRGTIDIASNIYYINDRAERLTLQEAFALEDKTFNEGYDPWILLAFASYGMEERIEFYDVNEDPETACYFYPETITAKDGTVYERICYGCSYDDMDVLYFDNESRPVNVKKAVLASIVSTGNDRCVIAPSVLKLPENITRYERPRYAFPKDTTGNNLTESMSTAYYNKTVKKAGSNVLKVLGEIENAYLVRTVSLSHTYKTFAHEYDERISMTVGTVDYFIRKDDVYLLSDFEELVFTPLDIEEKTLDRDTVDKVIARIPETGSCLAEGCDSDFGVSLLHIVREDEVIFI